MDRCWLCVRSMQSLKERCISKKANLRLRRRMGVTCEALLNYFSFICFLFEFVVSNIFLSESN
jgi:hypothetical protein